MLWLMKYWGQQGALDKINQAVGMREWDWKLFAKTPKQELKKLGDPKWDFQMFSAEYQI